MRLLAEDGRILQTLRTSKMSAKWDGRNAVDVPAGRTHDARCRISAASMSSPQLSTTNHVRFNNKENVAMQVRKFILLCCAGALWHTAHAQSTLGELLDQGGKFLSVDDIKSQLIGASIKWKNPSGLVEFDARPQEGGALIGTNSWPRGSGQLSMSSWTISEDGKLCLVASYRIGTQNSSFDRCLFWLRAGDNYWGSTSLSERDAKVFQFGVSK
jgi:hypothetical protein